MSIFIPQAFFLTPAKANRGFQPDSQTNANAIDAVETGCPGSGIRWLSGGSLVATEPRRARSGTPMFLFLWFEMVSPSNEQNGVKPFIVGPYALTHLQLEMINNNSRLRDGVYIRALYKIVFEIDIYDFL